MSKILPFIFQYMLVSAIMILSFGSAFANSNAQAPSVPPTSSLLSAPFDDPPLNQKNQTNTPRVRDVYLFGHEDLADKERNRAALTDLIVVKVEGLKNLLNRSRCVDANQNKLLGCEIRPLTLFIAGREIHGLNPEAVDKEEETITFHLHQTDHNTEVWTDLLGAPALDSSFFQRLSKISVGLDKGSPIPSTVKDFKIVRMDKIWFIGGLLSIAIIIFSVVYLAWTSDLLRVSGKPPVDAEGKTLVKAFSLSRFQMIFWFLLVVVAYSFFWLVMSSPQDVPASALALIGIGSTTALGAAVIDAKKNYAIRESQGFFKDILSDANGICIHRFQMLVWTFILGVMFLSSVYYDLAMPNFDSTLLLLQGVSSGAYLGLKIQEK